VKTITISTTVVVLLAVVIGVLKSRGGVPVGFEGLDPSLYSDDVSMRRSAWRKLAVEEPEKRKDIILPILATGLRDKDPEVRLYGAAIAGRISMHRPAGVLPPQTRVFTTDGKLRSALLDLMHDPDPETRVEAMIAIGLGVDPANDIEEKLPSLYAKEDSPRARESILGLIGVHHYATAGSIGLLSVGLDDPASNVRQRAARIVSELQTPPVSLLPKLVGKLATEEAGNLLAVIPAIAAYKSAAKPYVPQLEQAITKIDEEFRESYSKSYIAPLLAPPTTKP
jgi:HEAT repeat protein